MNEEEKQVIDDMAGEGQPGGEQAQYSQRAFSDTIREYIRKGNVTRVIVRRGTAVILDLPLNAGIVGGLIGAVAAPWAVIAAAVAAAGFDCTVELIKLDGEVVDLSPRKSLRGLTNAIRDAGNSIADEFRGGSGGGESAGGAEQTPPVDEEIPFDEPEGKE